MNHPAFRNLGVILFLLMVHASVVAQFPNLTTPNINGINGFKVRGLDKRDRVGLDISFAGDVNGDGIDDFIAGAPGLDPGGRVDAGGAYVFFGTAAGFGTEFDVATLNGTNGFAIHGKNAGDLAGFSVSTAGDINDDGFDDILLNGYLADDVTPPDLRNDRGEAYVIFGTNTGFPPVVELSSLDGSNGFTIEASSADQLFGIDVSHVGDVNDDGLDDIIIGSSDAPAFPAVAERVYVIFGSPTAFGSPGTPGPATINVADLDGSNGFQVLANEVNPISFGYVVNAAGDVNSDGVDDIAIAAPERNRDQGNAYIIYGKPSGDPFSATLQTSTLDGTNGFFITTSSPTFLGWSIGTIGDINQDGLDDLWIGAPQANSFRGVGYVIFGTVGGPPTTGTPARFDLSSLDGTNGFVIAGSFDAFFTGSGASSARDFNADGRNDLIVGSPGSEFNFNSQSGTTQVLFGTDAGFSARFDLPADLDGSNGFQFRNDKGLRGPCDGDPGCTQDDWVGSRVSAADINGDGLDDLLLGSHSPFFDPRFFEPDRVQLDGFYVLYGNKPPTINSLVPADDSELWYVSQLVLEVSEEAFPGSGNVEVRSAADNSLVESVNITSSAARFDNDRVTINLPGLLPGGDYYVHIPAGTILDEWGASVSITDNTAWNFKVFAPFITTWETTTGSMIIPTEGNGYDYDVTFTNLTNPGFRERSATGRTGNTTVIDLSNGDTYQITIRRDFPSIYFNNGSERNKIRTIEQWGDIRWTSMESAFEGCSNLEYNATDVPDLSGVSDLSSMFREASSFNGDLNGWNTVNIQSMVSMFNRATSFNGDISTWNTSNVTSMRGMFDRASSFNGDISTWNVGSVTNMGFMFSNAGGFNGNISGWNVSNVLDMEGMFINASGFNQDLSGWNVSSVTNLSRMLNDCGLDIANYDNLLVGWSTRAVQAGRTFGANGLNYSCHSEAERQSLIDDDGWTIQGDVSSRVVPDVTNLADVLAECEVTTLVEPSASSSLGTVTVVNDASLPITAQGTTVVTWTYTDVLNCEVTQTQNIVIDDVSDPVAQVRDITVQLDASGNASIEAADVDNGSSDNCSALTLGLDVTDFDCTHIGSNTVTLTATDGSGNANSTTTTVTVEDTTRPTAVARDITVQLDASGNATIIPADIDNGSTDNCGPPSLSLDVTNFSCSDVGTTIVTLTATDGLGNASNANAAVTVEDNLPSSIRSCPPDIISIDPIVNYDLPEATDNCAVGPPSLIEGLASGSSFPIGNTQVVYEFMDANGNTLTCSFMVIVEEEAGKEIDIPTGFTPNNDQVNDTWNILNVANYPGIRVTVYDRRGNELFSSVGYENEWDGSYRGDILPMGTYYYIVQLTGDRTIKGKVTIIR